VPLIFRTAMKKQRALEAKLQLRTFAVRAFRDSALRAQLAFTSQLPLRNFAARACTM